MRPAIRIATGAALLAAAASMSAKQPGTVAEEAQAVDLPAVPLWVQASRGMRNQGAANRLTRAHAAFAKHGDAGVRVAPSIENGDLPGCFVRYRKR